MFFDIVTAMNDTPNSNAADIIEKIMQTARAAMPDSILPDQLASDVKKNIRAAIQEVISDLDVVTREELDVQKEVLKKTRAKVDEMEDIISDLERQLKIK